MMVRWSPRRTRRSAGPDAPAAVRPRTMRRRREYEAVVIRRRLGARAVIVAPPSTARLCGESGALLSTVIVCAPDLTSLSAGSLAATSTVWSPSARPVVSIDRTAPVLLEQGTVYV